MSDQADLARGWLAKADSDLFNARTIAGTSGPYDTSCFHAQQAIEKSLKAFLAFHGQAIPRTHDLEVLELLCRAIGAMPALDVLDLAAISDFAVQLRYDFAIWPTQQEAQEAVIAAELVRSTIAAHLPLEAE
jgi:HEPN domain-containing protein